MTERPVLELNSAPWKVVDEPYYRATGEEV